MEKVMDFLYEKLYEKIGTKDVCSLWLNMEAIEDVYLKSKTPPEMKEESA